MVRERFRKKRKQIMLRITDHRICFDAYVAVKLLWCFSFAPGFSKLFGAPGSPSSGSLLCLLSPRL